MNITDPEYTRDKERIEEHIQRARERWRQEHRPAGWLGRQVSNIQENLLHERRLRIYRRVLLGKQVTYKKGDPAQDPLVESGLLRVTDQNTLEVRDRAYGQVFDEEWIRRNMPPVTHWKLGLVTTLFSVGTATAATLLIMGTLGIIQNGSFEWVIPLASWQHGGTAPVTIVTPAIHETSAAQLGHPTAAQTGRPKNDDAWLSQSFPIPSSGKPELVFSYRLCANDVLGYSDFHVCLRSEECPTSSPTECPEPHKCCCWDGTPVAEILRDGYLVCGAPDQAPPAGYCLHWQTASYDLKDHLGKTVWLVFENRNLHDGAWGVWTQVDNVYLYDKGLVSILAAATPVFLPAVSQSYDPAVYITRLSTELEAGTPYPCIALTATPDLSSFYSPVRPETPTPLP